MKKVTAFVGSARKLFLDRFGFAIHRPRYFGKAFTSIVTQAMGRGDKIVEYLDYTAFTLGFNTLMAPTVQKLFA